MSESFQLKVTGADELAKKFKGMETEAVTRLQKAMKTGVLYIHQQVPPYPPQGGAKGQGFKTAKQRRWFFWALRTGQITVPYRRTMTLGRSITTFKGKGSLSEVKPINEGVRGVIGTAIPYAQYVVGPQQAEVHRGKWWLLLDEVKKHLGKVTDIIQTEINRMLNE